MIIPTLIQRLVHCRGSFQTQDEELGAHMREETIDKGNIYYEIVTHYRMYNHFPSSE